MQRYWYRFFFWIFKNSTFFKNWVFWPFVAIVWTSHPFSFSLSYLLAGTSGTMMNRNSDCRQPCLVLILKGMLLMFHYWKRSLLYLIPIIKPRKFLFLFLLCWKFFFFFNQEWVLNFIKYFSLSAKLIIYFFPSNQIWENDILDFSISIFFGESQHFLKMSFTFYRS